MAQAFDPKALLAPKSAQSSKPASRAPANSFQITGQQPLDTDAGSQLANGSMNGSHSNPQFSSMYERMHNVERRHESAPKRRKVSHTTEEEQEQVANKKPEQHARGGGGDLGDFFKEKKEEALNQQGSTASVVDLTQDNPVQLAALLKKFLRDLPDPLMTYKLHRLFIASQCMYFLLNFCVLFEG